MVQNIKIGRYWVKTLDGVRWHVGDEPADETRDLGFRLGRTLYSATYDTPEHNLSRARMYAKALPHHMATIAKVAGRAA